MPFKDAKIYSDGSHYIAIPKTSNPYRRKKDTPQEVCSRQENQTTDKTENKKSATAAEKKTEFERLYKEYADSPKTERNRNIAEAMAGMELVLHFHLRRRQTHGTVFQDKVEHLPETLFKPQEMEVCGRVGAVSRETTVALPRDILYPRNGYAGKVGRTERLQFQFAQTADYNTKHLFQRAFRAK